MDGHSVPRLYARRAVRHRTNDGPGDTFAECAHGLVVILRVAVPSAPVASPAFGYAHKMCAPGLSASWT
jgi:hypothetical protein